MLLLLLLRNKFLAVVLNSTEGRIHVRTQFSVVLISTENEKRVTSPRHWPPYSFIRMRPARAAAARSTRSAVVKLTPINC